MEIMEIESDPEPIISCWRMRTMLERALIGTLSIATLVIICLIVVVALPKSSVARLKCETGVCIQQAYYLIDSMNTTIDPCDDFYEFACGGYIDKAVIPRHSKFVDPSERIHEFMYSQVRNEIEQPSLPNDIEPFVMLRKMYTSCMDTTSIENSGLDHMKLLLKRLGGWPILEKDSWVEIDWINITQRLRQYGFGTNQFMEIEVRPNYVKSSEYYITISEWDRIGEELNTKYKDFLINLALQFGAEVEFALDEVDAVMEFRANLSEALALQTDRYVITIGNLQAQYPSIPWIDFLNAALAIPNVTITDEAKVGVVSSAYISEFEKVIKQTPKRVQVNHALFEIIRSRINCLPNDIRKIQKPTASSTGITESRERWQTCLLMVTEHFHLAVDALYIRKFRNDRAKEEVTEIASNIKNMFIRILETVEWMDSETKASAVEKADMMSAYIEYPVELQNESNVVEYYMGLTFDAEYILEQIVQISKFKKDKILSLYKNPVVNSDWIFEVPSFFTNAYYDQQANSIYIPSGTMQDEYYTSGRPMYMNYGGIGTSIAHEIAHGFDNVHGKGFNKMGDGSVWWSESTDDAFAVIAECLVEQYNNYTIPESNLPVDGELTLVENIADTVGVMTAYLAYLQWVETHKQEPQLPGLNLTGKQLFWLSHANAHCSKYRQSHHERLLLDDHAPYRFRILGPFSNTQYFAEDYNCPLGSNMNPINKCEIW